MSKWYVRDGGRVMGPLTTAQVRDLWETGRIRDYNEASQDRRTWRALGLIPELTDDPAPPPRAPRYDVLAAPEGRVYALVAGGVAAVVLLGGMAVGGVMLMRPAPADPGAVVPPESPAP